VVLQFATRVSANLAIGNAPPRASAVDTVNSGRAAGTEDAKGVGGQAGSAKAERAPGARSTAIGQKESDPMLDLVLVVVTVAFFSVSILYARACERL
jgi:hypothetical protein